MDISRRSFLTKSGALTCGAVSCAVAAPADAAALAPERHGGDPSKRYAMAIDLRRCIGCQACTVACTMENQTPIGDFRTIVTQYDVVDVDDETRTVASFTLPRLCNHCDNPPCVPVCPVQATFQREDGIVVVDADKCVGCAYCVQACPYDARFINPVTNTADKCTFCVHRVEAGLLPACVETCTGGARIFGDVNDPESEISKVLAEAGDAVKVLRPEMGTDPHVYYIGLETAFEGKVEGQGILKTLQDKFGTGNEEARS